MKGRCTYELLHFMSLCYSFTITLFVAQTNLIVFTLHPSDSPCIPLHYVSFRAHAILYPRCNRVFSEVRFGVLKKVFGNGHSFFECLYSKANPEPPGRCHASFLDDLSKECLYLTIVASRHKHQSFKSKLTFECFH